MLANIHASKEPQKQKLTFDEFCLLVGFLAESKNKHLLIANEEELTALPLDQWLPKLKTPQ